MEGLLTRGDVVIITLQGEHGKTRPAVVIQTRALFDIPTVVVVPCTSEIVPDCSYRPDLPVGDETGLRVPSQAMADKIVSASLRRIKAVIGRVPVETLNTVTDAVLFVTGAFD